VHTSSVQLMKVARTLILTHFGIINPRSSRYWAAVDKKMDLNFCDYVDLRSTVNTLSLHRTSTDNNYSNSADAIYGTPTGKHLVSPSLPRLHRATPERQAGRTYRINQGGFFFAALAVVSGTLV
jgi:hypothetical protein